MTEIPPLPKGAVLLGDETTPPLPRGAVLIPSDVADASEQQTAWNAPGVREPVTQPVRDNGLLSKIRRWTGASTDMLFHGLTAGYGDELMGGVSKLLGRGYDRGLQEQRDITREARSTLGPIASTGIEAVGSILPVAPLVKLFGAGRTIGGQIVRGAGAGATAGGVIGFGQGEGLEDRAVGTAIGVGAGGIMGGAMPVLIQGAIALATVPSKVANLIRTSAPERQAQKRLLTAFERDGIDETAALAKIKEWQAGGAKPEALADLGGENVRGLVSAAARTPGQGKETAQTFIEGRRAGRTGRIDDDLTGLSPNRDYAGTIDILDDQAKRAGPLFDQAFKANRVVESPMIDRILATTDGKNALKQAAVTMQNDMARMGTPDPELTEVARILAARGEMDPVKGGVAPGLNLRALHHAREELWDAAQAAMEKNAFGVAKDTARSRSIKKLWGSLTDEIDRLDATAVTGPNSVSPQGGLYRQARAAYAGPRQGQEALAMGRRALADDADITAREVADLSPGEKELFRAGMTRAILDKVKATPDGANEVRRFFGNDLVRERIAAGFPDKPSFDRFAAQMKRESGMADLETALSPRTGSQTTPLAWEGGEKIAGALDAGLAAARGDAVGAIASIGRRALRAAKMSPDVASEIVRKATSPAQAQEVRALFQELTAKTTSPVRRSQIVRELRELSAALPAQNQDRIKSYTQ